MLKQRLATAFIISPIALAGIWFGTPWFTILIALSGIVGILEFYRLCGVNLKSILGAIGLLMTVLLIVSPHLAAVGRADIIGVGATVSLLTLLARRDKTNAFRDWAWMLGGVVYIGLLLSYLISIRAMPFGREWVYLAMVSNVGTDVFAFFVGRAFGCAPLAPSISPKKTWAGLWGGFFGAIIVGMPLYHFMNFPTGFGYGGALLICVLIGIFAPLGDLVESLFKRNCQTKEAGSILPGHGGFLDRLDSVVISSAVAYFFIIWAGFGG